MVDDTAQPLPRGRFVILDWSTAHANHATLEEALGHAQKEQQTHPSKTFAVLQLVATVEPSLATNVKMHRF